MVTTFTLPGTHDEWFAGEHQHVVPYHRMYSKQYCLPSLVVYRQETVTELEQAAEALDRVMWKTMRFVQRYLDEEAMLEQLAIPQSLLTVASMELPMHGISRQDWIVCGPRLKCIEFNTDTPTGVPESAYLSDVLIREANRLRAHSGERPLQNPSELMDESIIQAFKEMVRLFEEAGYRLPVVFSCDPHHAEDLANTRYVMNIAEKAGITVTFAPLSELVLIPDEGLFAGDLKIEIWYRLYPLEYLAEDVDREGYPIGRKLLSLIEQGALTVINPTQSIISQSKGMLALIWKLYKQNDRLKFMLGLNQPLYHDADCAAIEQWMLPADWSAEFFESQSVPYVSKSMFGREGKGTALHQLPNLLSDGPIVRSSEKLIDEHLYYEQQPKIYQQYESMMPLTVSTENGDYEGFLLTGVYVIGRKYAGLLPRIGGRVTGDSAYFCAAAMES